MESERVTDLKIEIAQDINSHSETGISYNIHIPQYIDVIYLKNESVIKGMFIEQTPLVSLKIQTKDESIFVYEMHEVLKMTNGLCK